MNKKTYNLIVAIFGGLSTIASAVVAYFNINDTPAIIASIGVVNTAFIEICSKFVKTE